MKDRHVCEAQDACGFKAPHLTDKGGDGSAAIDQKPGAVGDALDRRLVTPIRLNQVFLRPRQRR